MPWRGRLTRCLLRVKANSNLAILNLFARARRRLRHRLRRRTGARPRGRRRAPSGVSPASARRARKCAPRWRSRHPLLQRRIRQPSWNSSTKSPAAGPARAGVAARQSGRRPEDASLHLHRPQDRQVRRCLRGGLPLYRRAAALPHLEMKGIDCHIGSQLLDPAPAAEAAAKVLGLVDRTGRRPASHCRTHRPRRRHGHPLPRRSRRRPPTTWAPMLACWPAARKSCCSSRAARWSATPACCSRGSST
jgi:hypothetical protein